MWAATVAPAIGSPVPASQISPDTHVVVGAIETLRVVCWLATTVTSRVVVVNPDAAKFSVWLPAGRPVIVYRPAPSVTVTPPG